MIIQPRKLAMGVALATSIASLPVGACMLPIPTIPDGLQTAHPASVSVSVATRHAVDTKSIKDIPCDLLFHNNNQVGSMIDLINSFCGTNINAMHL